MLHSTCGLLLSNRDWWRMLRTALLILTSKLPRHFRFIALQIWSLHVALTCIITVAWSEFSLDTLSSRMSWFAFSHRRAVNLKMERSSPSMKHGWCSWAGEVLKRELLIKKTYFHGHSVCHPPISHIFWCSIFNADWYDQEGNHVHAFTTRRSKDVGNSNLRFKETSVDIEVRDKFIAQAGGALHAEKMEFWSFPETFVRVPLEIPDY